MASLRFDKNLFVFECSFEERALAKAAGFKWDDKDRTWYSTSLMAAARLKEFATDQVKTLITSKIIAITPWLKPLPLPEEEGDELFPHQIEAIKFALERNNSYLALDPGLGKTCVAAMVAKALCYDVVYVCPPFLVENVREEFKRWAPGVRITFVKDSLLSRGEIHFDGDHLSRTMIVADEAHRLKNPQSNRTKNFFKLAEKFPKKIFMSGTPMPNRPIELFSILDFAAPETIGFRSFFDYAKRYCGAYLGPNGWDFSGATHLDELGGNLIHPRGKFMLRQKKDILNLPSKLEEVFILSSDCSPMVKSLEMEIRERYKTTDDIIKHQISSGEGDIHTVTYRRLLGREKAPSVAEFVKALILETTECVLLYAIFKETILDLTTLLSDFEPLIITGDTPMNERHERVKTFQNSKARLMIGNPMAMGVGFTLTKASRVLFAEFDWTPGVNDQASDRAHRIGTKHSVLVQYMVYKNSIDKLVLETLLRKRKNIKTLLKES